MKKVQEKSKNCKNPKIRRKDGKKREKWENATINFEKFRNMKKTKYDEKNGDQRETSTNIEKLTPILKDWIENRWL